ncbi:hypothetical protein PAT3040_05777, partial [Paenibacillus agaridevorans]
KNIREVNSFEATCPIERILGKQIHVKQRARLKE